MRIIVTLFLSLSLFAAECPPVSPKAGLAVDADCHTFTIRREGKQRVITYHGQREIVDCSKAVRDPFGGWWDYYSHLVNARIYCPGRK